MSQTSTNAGGTVVAFRLDAARARRPIAGEENRGAILLFTGIRYERYEPQAARKTKRRTPRPEEA